MNKQKLNTIIDTYKESLESKGFKAIEIQNYNKEGSSFSQKEKLDHVLFMVTTMKDFIEKDEIDKASRWLGFVQGVLWNEDIYSISEMRDQNRS